MHNAGAQGGTRDELIRARTPTRGRQQRRRSGRAKVVLQAVFGVVGVAALVLLIRSIGAQNLAGTLSLAAPWLPLVLALDVLRMGCEALGTFYLSHRVRRLPAADLARI